MKQIVFFSVVILMAGALVACRPAGSGGPTTMKAVSWKDMNRRQRLQHMKKVVMPRMAKVFQGYDADRYAKANCMLCHGKGAMKGKFAMPNAALPKLSFTGNFKKHDKKAVAFMARQVVPAMRTLLGAGPFDPKTRTGFGCVSCHIVGP